MQQSRRFDVVIEDSTDRLGVLSLQGPTSRDILMRIAGPRIETLRYFGLMKTRLGGVEVVVSRTGYTGDLGFERNNFV